MSRRPLRTTRTPTKKPKVREAELDVKEYVLISPKGLQTTHVLTAVYPKYAARKAVTLYPKWKEYKLWQKGTNRVFVFEGEMQRVSAKRVGLDTGGWNKKTRMLRRHKNVRRLRTEKMY